MTMTAIAQTDIELEAKLMADSDWSTEQSSPSIELIEEPTLLLTTPASMLAQADIIASLTPNELIELSTTQTTSVEQRITQQLTQELSHSPLLSEQMIQGTVLLRLSLNARGQLSTCEIVSSLSSDADAIALEAMSRIQLDQQIYLGARHILLPVVFSTE